MNFRRSRHLAAVGLVAMMLAGCEVGIPDISPFGKKAALPACPTVRILPSAAEITSFRAGPGRDITDIEYEARMAGFQGDCEYNGDSPDWTSVDVVVKPAFEVGRGPAAASRTVALTYFVAISNFHPDPKGKSEFKLQVAFPENRNNVQVVDNEVRLNIPLSADLQGPDVDIFMGFALTREQLDYNRNRQRGRRNAAGGR